MHRRFSQESNLKIGIVGAGSYGTALAQCLGIGKNEILLVSKTKDVAHEINQQHTNEKALPSVELSPKIRCGTDCQQLADMDIVFIAVPAQNVLEVCLQIDALGRPLVICSKGLDPKTGDPLSKTLDINISSDFVFLSGPSFAIEIAKGVKAVVNISGKNGDLAREISYGLSSEQFEIKPTGDYIGLQIFGVFKNILAVGCGILDGLQAGSSCTAKLITRGIQEIITLTEKMGGNRDTFFEVGGIGDIFLTCTSEKSRNIAFGKFCACDDPRKWQGALAEGALSVKWIPHLEEKYRLQMPFFRKIYSIVYENLPPKEIMA